MPHETLPPRAAFGVRFSLLARRWRRQIEARLASNGLTDTTWIPLVHLHRTGGGVTQKELAALVGVDGSSLVRVLDILAQDGLIERRKDAVDGRARRIWLTRDGTRRVAEIMRHLVEAEEQLLVDLSDAQISEMLAQFDRIEQRMSDIATPQKTGSAPS